jgi:hypothetical protein
MIRPTFETCPILPKRPDGWYFATPFPDWPECGPYATKAECEEARGSLVRNWIGNFPARKVCTALVLIVLSCCAGCSSGRSLIITAAWREGEPATASVELKTDLS